MADPRNEYGANPIGRTDEYGNPARHGDQYGNYPAGTNVGATGLHAGVTDVGGHIQQERPGYGGSTGTTLQRSGSRSSSSSEDDGQGGRRKKGLKEKIKEKLPGGHKDEHEQVYGTHTAATTGAAGYGTGYGTGHAGHEPEKKGIMEKIKEKLPGGHH